MIITRIQIEGGFLDGFDLQPASGLSVFIGARGTGKTSVIELVRYALAAKSHTAESQSRSLEHARAVLGGGEITVTLTDVFDEVIVSRSSDDDAPRASQDFVAPIVLSQTEIETLGLSEAGRLSLLDGFVTNRAKQKKEEAAAVSSIQSSYKEINALEAEIASLNQGLTQLQQLTEQLATAEKQQAKTQGVTDEIKKKQKRLTDLNAQSAQLAIKEEVLDRFHENVLGWADSLNESIAEDFGPDSWDGKAEDDPLRFLRAKYSKAVKDVGLAAQAFQSMGGEAKASITDIASKKAVVEKEARGLRADLEKIAAGAGALAKQIGNLKAQIAQFQSRAKVVAERNARLQALRTKRNSKVAELEAIRDKRSTQRAQAASELSKALSPHIKIEVERSAQYGEYTKAVAAALRGSGLKYTDLAATITDRVSPRELMTFVESSDFDGLADIVGIPADRAARLIGHLREVGVADILTCDIDDNAKMSLLDGVVYKEVGTLSAGQRCTVVLSVVLQHKSRTLVIDQPEDHLDNAFIANTVIKALRNQKKKGQVILSTHNANIPVLGDADLIVELTSDGQNGFIQICKPLKDSAAVEAISNVMEGGKEAFQYRADFYEEHGE